MANLSSLRGVKSTRSRGTAFYHGLIGHTTADSRPGRDAIDGLGTFIENKHWFPPASRPDLITRKAKDLEKVLESHIKRVDAAGARTVKFVFRGRYRQEWVDALRNTATRKEFPQDQLLIEFRELDPILGVPQ